MRSASEGGRGAAALALALGLTALAGCVDYLDRRETISPYAGEALAANKLAQTADPWPSGSTALPANGSRMRLAIERYNTNTSIAPHGLATSSISPASTGSGNSAGPGASPAAPAN